jgi:hypothetical protein
MILATLPLGWRLCIVLVRVSWRASRTVSLVAARSSPFPRCSHWACPRYRPTCRRPVGVVPSYLGSLRVFRAQLRPHVDSSSPWFRPCVLGTATGTALLLNGSPSTFRLVVPWLIGAGTILFASLARDHPLAGALGHDHAARRWALYVGIFAVSIYGGYFGAGLGILLLAVMALALPSRSTNSRACATRSHWSSTSSPR